MEKDADAPPEKLRICFTVAEITVLGSGLQSLERAIQKYALKLLKSTGRRYMAALKTHVAAVIIIFSKETP